MATKSNQLISLPGEAQRETWLCSAEGHWEFSPDDAAGNGGVLILEALSLDSAPFWARTPQEGELNLEEVTSLHWEAQGLEERIEGRSVACWNVLSEKGRVLVGTAALAREPLPDAWLSLSPLSCEISPLVYPIPAQEVAIWKELGRYVVAFQGASALVHFTTLSSRQLDAAAACEIIEMMSALSIRGMLPKLKGVRVWCEVEVDFAAGLKNWHEPLIVIEEPKPTPRLPAQASGIHPPELAEKRRLQKQSAHRLRLLLLGAAAYAAVFAMWAGSLAYRAERLSREEKTLSRLEPELAVVREAQLRWQLLEAATNPDQYPVEVFHRIASLLPEQGIRLEEFVFDTIDAKKIIVRGQASSSGEAVKFVANIKNSETLKQYPWDAPVPTILPDNRASFRAEGALQPLTPSTHEPE